MRVQPDAVNANETREDLPPTLLDYYKDVELSMNVLHVNNIPFLGSISKNINYVTINALDNMKIPTMENVIEQIICLYAIWRFNIALMHVDIQFKAIKDQKNISTAINVVSKGENVLEIEWMNCVLKEHV